MNQEDKLKLGIIKARKKLREEFDIAQKILLETTLSLDKYLENLTPK